MVEEITLGVHGDVNRLRNRFANGLSTTLPLRIDSYDQNGDTYYVTVQIEEPLRLQCAGLLAEYIIERYETGLLNSILLREHDYLTPARRRDILRGVSRFADDAELGYAARRQVVASSLMDYLGHNHTLLMDGFVTFRLKKYEELLNELCDRMIDDYLIQKEYDEFLSLLQYFVRTQRNRPPLTHVVVQADGSYQVVDETDRNITDQCVAEIQEEGEELSDLTLDDILISVLISLAPLNIVVHNKEHIKNVELFTTIAKVFDGNISYCNGCSMCMASHQGARQL